jgi:hypothetical protein
MPITQLKKANELFFDYQNPRMVEFNISKNTSEKDIINLLWTEMAVNEIVMSILAHGFFENEAMYAVEESGRMVIVEGNRRLAAVKLILDPGIIKGSGMNKYADKITDKLRNQLSNELPVIVLDDREEAWRYIGFKHVNGPAKWGSYAKAQYIANVHHEFKISLDLIAEQIGDSNKQVQKLYQALMILRQADENTDFKINDIFYKRVYFSHLSTAIGYEGYQNFIGLEPNNYGNNPIPEEKYQDLKDLMFWLFGSKEKEIKPIIISQNPDLSTLNDVLKKRESVEALKTSGNLALAYDLSLEGSQVLYKSLISAKIALEKALSKQTSYEGDLDTLKSSGSVSVLADALYDALEKKFNEKKGVTKKKRFTEE